MGQNLNAAMGHLAMQPSANSSRRRKKRFSGWRQAEEIKETSSKDKSSRWQYKTMHMVARPLHNNA